MLDSRAQRNQQAGFHRRLRLFALAMGVVFLLTLLRFYQFQIIKGAYFRELSEGNRLALVKMRAPRGIVFDRNRQVLVSNRPSFRATLVLEDVQDLDRTVGMLASTLGLDAGTLKEACGRVGRYRMFEPLVVKEDLDRDTLARLEAVKFRYPGLDVEVEPRRDYPQGGLAAHVLGYMGEVGAAEMEAGGRYRPGDYVGKTGLEKKFNDQLRGIDGGLQVEVDSLGRRLRVISRQDSVPGCNLVLSIDRDIQRVAEEALGEVRGAVVVMDPAAGEVLAAVSHPGYDPNLFSAGIGTEDWRRLSEDGRHPMQNRTIQSQYPPGSVFKLVMAVAALQEGVIDENTAFWCGGGLQFGNRYYRCWKKEGHGHLGVHRALVESCDTFFYILGQKLGIDRIARYARELGLGSVTELGLTGEARGLIPDSAWKRATRGEPWYPGENLSAAIGQGYNLLTPMQMAVMVSAVATDGKVLRPGLVKRVEGPDGNVVEEFGPRVAGRADVDPRVFAAVRRGMWGVVNEPGGTGSRARLKSVGVAGKTGTAQVVKMRQAGDEGSQDDLPEHLRDHAWFACFAPYGDPRVVVVVVMENAGHGGSVCAPVAQRILKAIFEKEPAKEPGKPDEGEV